MSTAHYEAEVAQRKLASHLKMRQELLNFLQQNTGGDFLAAHYLNAALLSVSLRPCIAVSICGCEQYVQLHQRLVEFLGHADLEVSLLVITDETLALTPADFRALIEKHEQSGGDKQWRAAALCSAFLPLHVDTLVSSAAIGSAANASASPTSSSSSSSSAAAGAADDDLELVDDEEIDEDGQPRYRRERPLAVAAASGTMDEHDIELARAAASFAAAEDAAGANIMANLVYLSGRFTAAVRDAEDESGGASSGGSNTGTAASTRAADPPAKFALFAVHRYNALPSCAFSIVARPDARAAAQLRANGAPSPLNNRLVFERLAFDACGHLHACARIDATSAVLAADADAARVQTRLDALMAAVEPPSHHSGAGPSAGANGANASAEAATAVAADAIFPQCAPLSRAARVHAAFGLVRLIAASRSAPQLAAEDAPWLAAQRLEADRAQRWRAYRPLAANRNGVIFTPAHIVARWFSGLGVGPGLGAGVGGTGALAYGESGQEAVETMDDVRALVDALREQSAAPEDELDSSA